MVDARRVDGGSVCVAVEEASTSDSAAPHLSRQGALVTVKIWHWCACRKFELAVSTCSPPARPAEQLVLRSAPRRKKERKVRCAVRHCVTKHGPSQDLFLRGLGLRAKCGRLRSSPSAITLCRVCRGTVKLWTTSFSTEKNRKVRSLAYALMRVGRLRVRLRPINLLRPPALQNAASFTSPGSLENGATERTATARSANKYV